MQSYYFFAQRREDLVTVSVTALNPVGDSIKSYYILLALGIFRGIYTLNQPLVRYRFYNLPFAPRIVNSPLLFSDDGVFVSDPIIEFVDLNSDSFNSEVIACASYLCQSSQSNFPIVIHPALSYHSKQSSLPKTAHV